MRRIIRRIFGGGVALLALLCAVALSLPSTALALDLAAPSHNKSIASNGDGTYTISLDVKGGKASESETVTQKTDVVLVMDVSGSMDYAMDRDEKPWWDEKSRLDYAKAAAKGLVNSVVKDGSDDVQVAVVSFAKNAQTVQAFSSDKGALSSAIDGLRAGDGTNWEAGLAEANGLSARDGAKKYVVFLSDGEPTYRYETETYKKWDWDSWSFIDATRTVVAGNGSGYEQANFDHAVAEAKKGTDAGVTLFSVAVGSTQKVSDRMNAFQSEVTGSTKGCYSATTPDELNQAFADITAEITRSAKYTNVTITDKLTQYVKLSGANANGNVRVTAKDAAGNKVELSEDDYSLVANGDTVALTFRQGTGDKPGFILADGVTYTVSFDVVPTQVAYDAAADAGTKTTLPTNASGTLTYSVVNDNGTTQTVIPGARQSYEPQQITVPVNTVHIQKAWEGGSVRPDSVTVKLLCDGKDYTTVALNKSDDYKADVVVPAGVGAHKWSLSEVTKVAGYAASYSEAIEGSGTLTVTNKYSAASVKTKLSGHKTLTGRALAADEFSFKLADESGKLLQTVTNDADGNFNFDDLTFDKPGVYTYSVSEDISKLPADVSPVTVGSKAVKITVTDNGKGQLMASVKGDLEFENAYKADAVMFPRLSFTKSLTGREGGVRDDEFTFQLKDAEGNVVAEAKNDASGTVTFSPRIVFGEAGTYVYTVSEVNSGKKGVTYDSAVRTVTITVTDEGKGQLDAAYAIDGDTTFTNAYKPEAVGYSVSQDVKVSKALEGRALRDGEFAFELVENGQVVATAVNDVDGNVTFGKLTYTEPGEHAYEVREAKGDTPGITFDDSAYVVKVSVTDDGAGRLVAKASSDEGPITFTNRYDAAAASITFGATKKLEGAKLTEGQFAFQVKDEQGNVVASATNAADGSVVFGDLALDAVGDYHFTMSEVDDGQANVTYDDAAHALDVTVDDDGQGHLYVASYTVDGGAELPTFTNGYVAPATPEQPSTPAAEVPNTGDASTSALPVILGACALLAASALVVRARRNDR